MSKTDLPRFHLLIPAAGSGVRAGGALPKQYTKIAGKTILRHTLDKFMQIQDLIKSIRVVIDPAHADLYHDAIAGLAIEPPVMGAGTRKQSVYNGLQSLCHPERSEGSLDSSALHQNDIILIHDAARPLVSIDSIQSLLLAMTTEKAATLVAPLADTIVGADYTIHDRTKLNAVQTPQAFIMPDLLVAHNRFKNDDSFTDDAGLMAASGHNVQLVAGERTNFKITTAEDLIMAERLLGNTTETRTGFGYDVHAFDPAPADNIRLGGIDIPFTRKLLGHSDADVILHAVTDALLGAIGDGDIGQLFPPSDQQWKGADSAIFVIEAVKRVHAKGGKIINIDITLIAESPKIGPYRGRMLTRLSDILQLPADRIGLKATTSEGLGYTGRGEGIVAQAVATITLPTTSS